MAARIDPARWYWWAGLAVISVAVGGLAGINPQFAVAAALGLAFTLVVLADLAVGLALFTFLCFVALFPSGVGPAVSFVKVAGLLLALSWLATVSSRPGSEIEFFADYSALATAVLLFLAWVALSYLWAENGAHVLKAFSRYGLNFLLFPIVLTAVTNRRQLSWTISAFVAGAVAAAAYGLATPTPADTLDADRLSGTIGNPNELAAILVAGTALSFGMAAATRGSPGKRLIWLFAGTFCVAGVILTFSRTGLVALAFAGVAAIVFFGRLRVRAALTVLLVAFAGFGYFTAVASPEERARITDPGNGTGRTDLWEVARRMIAAQPIVGIGAGNFVDTSIHYLLQPGALQRSEFIVDTPKVAHNTYLEVFAELGIIGFVLFLAILYGCLSCAARGARLFAEHRDTAMEMITRSLLVGLVGMLAANFFSSDQFQKSLWLLLALCPAVYAIARRQASESETADR